MKFLKFMLFLVLIALIGGALYFATQDGNYSIEESRVIEAPRSVVYDIVNDYTTWEAWGPWKKEDPSMTFSYPEKTTGEGASYSWEGEISGAIKTLSAQEDKALQQQLSIQTPGGERNPEVQWTFSDTENGGTKVSWSMSGEHTLLDKAYFAFSGVNFDQEQRQMYTDGLEGLASYVKERVEAYTVTVDGVTQHGGGFYLYKTTSANAQNISMVMGQNYGVIMEFMQTNAIKQSGMPFTIYNQMLPDGAVIMSNAIPVKDKIIIPGDQNILSGYMPKTTALKVTLKGNYTYLSKAWEEAMTHLAKNAMQQSELPPFEVYTTDPGDYPNPANWITEIYIPLK